MGKTINPVDMARELPREHLQWVQSVHKEINGGLDIGRPVSKDSTGTWSTFNQGNGNGVLIRVGAAGTSNGRYNWTAANVGVVINHGLNRQPVGYHVVDMDKMVTVFRTVVADAIQITLAPSDATVNVTVYIF
jgi:hypothetical protein